MTVDATESKNSRVRALSCGRVAKCGSKNIHGPVVKNKNVQYKRKNEKINDRSYSTFISMNSQTRPCNETKLDTAA